jgi:barbiturase
MVEKVAAAVKDAMHDAGIDDPKDVHYVQTKTPLLTIESVRDAEAGATGQPDRLAADRR